MQAAVKSKKDVPRVLSKHVLTEMSTKLFKAFANNTVRFPLNPQASNRDAARFLKPDTQMLLGVLRPINEQRHRP